VSDNKNKINNGLLSNENELADAKQLGMWAAITSLGYVFWLVGGMELVERMAYYGVKSSASLYATNAQSTGALGLSITDYGLITMTWALVQTFVPVFSGGLADRMGYKETIFNSTIIKISGYITMAFFPSFWGFMSGAVLLAAGTGIFKPGIQGTLANATTKESGSMAWGIFYQIVNIGSFVAPLIAVHFRQLSWDSLFFVCAAIISCNFIMLLMYKEPGKEERLALQAKIKAGDIKQPHLWRDAWSELSKPIVYWYMLVFAGFWFLFNALFDVLPMHVRDWVDTSIVVRDLFGEEGTRNGFAIFWLGLDQAGTKVMPEGIVNLNALMIMTTCFLVAGLTAKYRITSAMFAGAIASVVSILMIGGFNSAWMVIFAVALFSLGEMMISPKKNEYMSNIAPKNKKAMYLGFVMLPQGIGWGLEGYFGPWLYSTYASKENFARELLISKSMTMEQIAAIPQGEAFNHLVKITGESAQTMTQQLYSAHNVSMAWYIIGAIGMISAVGILLYGKWIFQMERSKVASTAG
jgi:dipeptide/tripeptide permease